MRDAPACDTRREKGAGGILLNEAIKACVLHLFSRGVKQGFAFVSPDLSSMWTML